MPNPEYGHPRVVKPRKRGYKHKPIIAVVETIGLTDTGEYVDDLPMFAMRHDSHLWVTFDVPQVVLSMVDTHGENPAFRLGGGGVAPPEDGSPYIDRVKLTTFGFATPGKRHTARHVIVSPGYYMGGEATARTKLERTLPALLTFATALREWCESQDIPIARSLAGIGSSLARDARFWPDTRGRVPRATNEQVRPYLPGSHVECAVTNTHHKHVLTIDQRRAYHTIATEIALPDPTSLYARGYFRNPGNHRVWTTPGDRVYERTINQPGLYALLVRIDRAAPHNLILPYLQESTWEVENRKTSDHGAAHIVYVWSPEMRELRIDPRVTILGMTAAWTSRIPEVGLADYARWARKQIDTRPDLKQWLKPTLHGMYGLLASKPANLIRAELNMRGGVDHHVYYSGRKLELKAKTIRHVSPITNVCVLGVLQAELRVRTLEMARDLRSHGREILRLHSDGIHFTPGQVPMYDETRWELGELTNVRYFDAVTYISNERVVAPGRGGDDAHRIQRIRERAESLIRMSSQPDTI